MYKKIIMASNAYYNDALEKAGVRNLSGAVESLKVSLRFHKLNIDARNLLGLVYFEMGEVVAALTEWVISKNYQPRENIASRYLDEIQQNQGRLDTINQTIKKYNQALQYCRQGSRDLAIIQLKKVLSLNPKLVKGHQLLALLYIQDKKYDQAKKVLRNAGKIDTNNTLTLRYLREANIGIRESSSERKPKNDDLISYQSGNETIIQPRHLKDTSVVGTIINMVIGIAIGAAITGFLIVPGVKREIQNQAKTEVIEANNVISTRNQTISTLEGQIETLTAQLATAETNVLEGEGRTGSYEQLLLAYQAYVGEDIQTAGDILAKVDTTQISDSAKTIYDTINAAVNAEYIKNLYDLGYTAYSSRKFDEAVENLKKVVEIDEAYDNGNALYYLAQACRKNDDMTTARTYYERFVELYPGTERAATAQSYLNIE
ncbi:MAG: tetratricopeptide repeat protein [Roseburia sp.]|nr:tetratricopeptide repeat protein [Roseburia sp.]